MTRALPVPQSSPRRSPSAATVAPRPWGRARSPSPSGWRCSCPDRANAPGAPERAPGAPAFRGSPWRSCGVHGVGASVDGEDFAEPGFMLGGVGVEERLLAGPILAVVQFLAQVAVHQGRSRGVIDFLAVDDDLGHLGAPQFVGIPYALCGTRQLVCTHFADKLSAQHRRENAG